MPILIGKVGYDFYISGEVSAVPSGAAASFTFTGRGGRLPIVFDYETTLPDDTSAEWTFTDNGDGTFTVATASATTAGTFSLTVNAVDAERYPATKTVTIQVIAVALSVSGTLDDETVGVADSENLSVVGGIAPYTVVSSTLPAGKSAALTGGLSPLVVSGTATGAGLGPGTSFPFDVSITVEDDVGTQYTFEQTINVLVTAVSLSYTLGDATEGSPYSESPTVSGGTGGYSNFTITSGSLPSSLSINSGTGVLSGTPDAATAGTYPLTIECEDSEGNVGQWMGSLEVDASSVWTLGGQWTPNGQLGGWGGYTLRGQIPASGMTAGSKIRLYLTAGAAGSAIVGDMYVQFQAAPNPNFTTTPIAVTVGGMASFTVPAGTTVMTDEIVIAVDSIQDLLVATYFSGAATLAWHNSNVPWGSWYKLANDASTVTGSGYTLDGASSYFVTRIDILVP